MGAKTIYRKLLKRMPFARDLAHSIRHKYSQIQNVSTDYEDLRDDETRAEADRLRDAWRSKEIPLRQRALVDMQISAYRDGQPIAVFDTLVSALRALPLGQRGTSILEIGCSSGYYSEVFEIAGISAVYRGCDYSEAFISLARQIYPKNSFDVEDATRLKYTDNEFDIAISGCCLLHIPNYADAIVETSRVARRYAIFHRTPVVIGRSDRYFRKKAYGVETVEIHFNEPEFIERIVASGLKVIATYTLDETSQESFGAATRTYVCEKIHS